MDKKIWFPAKRYGWGWGPPVTWQGWLVLFGYLALSVLGAVFFFPPRQPYAFAAYEIALTCILIIICWLKGEPPKWRWGDK